MERLVDALHEQNDATRQQIHDRLGVKLSGQRTSLIMKPWPQLGHLELQKTVRTGFHSVDQLVHHLVPSTTNISSILHHHRRHSAHLPHRYNRVECGIRIT